MRFNFDQFVEYGRAHGANIVNGMPWSFTFYGEPVTHESDTLYLIGPLRFTPSDVIQIERGEVVICNDGAELDMVLAAYAAECGGEFNAKVLADFVATYPKHREALNRYAYIQLSSVRATPEEIVACDRCSGTGWWTPPGGNTEPCCEKPRYTRKPEADRRIARGDDFAGDAWLDTATGQTVYTVVGFDRNSVPTMVVENGSAVPVGVSASEPCAACGNEVRGQGGYLSCECPAVSVPGGVQPSDTKPHPPSTTDGLGIKGDAPQGEHR